MRINRSIARILSVAALSAAVCGCDFFRHLAGRPDSAFIETKKLEIEKSEARARAVEDSLRFEEKRRADAAAYADSIASGSSMVVPVSRIPGLAAARLSQRYYIMVGTFSTVENADKQVSMARAAGFDAVKIAYGSHKVAVAVNPSDDPVQVYKSLKNAKKESFCPSDVWVLVNE